jgi:hypothetical protein
MLMSTEKRKSMAIRNKALVSEVSLYFTGLTACLILDLSLDARFMLIQADAVKEENGGKREKSNLI